MKRKGGKKYFRSLEGEALVVTFPLMNVQTLHTAASGMAEATAESLENLPLEGKKDEPRINLKGIEGTQTQMF